MVIDHTNHFVFGRRTTLLPKGERDVCSTRRVQLGSVRNRTRKTVGVHSNCLLCRLDHRDGPQDELKSPLMSVLMIFVFACCCEDPPCRSRVLRERSKRVSFLSEIIML